MPETGRDAEPSSLRSCGNAVAMPICSSWRSKEVLGCVNGAGVVS